MKSCYKENGLWLKGNLHSHSTVSDGRLSPVELAKEYKEKGYDFLSMSDHNLFVSHDELADDAFLLLTGVEHDIEYNRDKCVHIVGTAAPGRETTGYEMKRYSKGELSDEQLADRMRTDGQFVTLAHPVWSRMEPEEILALQGFHAVEVFNNGTEHLCHAGNAEVYWDLLLRHGRRVFATASDDVHVPDDLFGGWICVKAAERSKEAILQALFAGEFYASQGPEIREFGTEGDEVIVQCSDCREIHFVTYEIRGKSFFAEEGSSLTEGRYRLTGNESYVRAVCVDTAGHSAWTQPIYLK